MELNTTNMPFLSPSPWRRSQIGVLLVLLAALGIMGTAVVHQNKTIHDQKELILLLDQDSVKLAHIEMEQAAKELIARQKLKQEQGEEKAR